MVSTVTEGEGLLLEIFGVQKAIQKKDFPEQH
jgi:hypothetical protein